MTVSGSRRESRRREKRAVVVSFNKSINGWGNVVRSFQPYPHVIFAMLTCRNKRKRLSNHQWWYSKYMGTCGKLMKCWKNWKMWCSISGDWEKMRMLDWEVWKKALKCVWNCLYLWFNWTHEVWTQHYFRWLTLSIPLIF